MARVSYAMETGTIAYVGDLRNVGDNKTAVRSIGFFKDTPRTQKDGQWVDAEPPHPRIEITVWGKDAEQAGILRAGDRIVVSGRTGMREGYTKNDGTEVPPSHTITADAIGILLATKRLAGGLPEPEQKSQQQYSVPSSGNGGYAAPQHTSASNAYGGAPQQPAAPQQPEIPSFGSFGDEPPF